MLFVNNQLVSAGEDHKINLYHSEKVESFDTEAGVIVMAFSTHLQCLAAGLYTGHINIYDNKFSKQQSIKAHEGFIFGLAFLHNTIYLASAGFDDKLLIIWDTTN